MACGIDRLQPAVHWQAGKIGKRRTEWIFWPLAGKAEVVAERVVDHQPVQPAPLVVALIGRAAEGGRECRALQQLERGLQALQNDNIAPARRIGHARHIEEVQP